MAHDQEIVGSKPGTIYWMDVSGAIYYIKKVEIKVANCCTPKKIQNPIGQPSIAWEFNCQHVLSVTLCLSLSLSLSLFLFVFLFDSLSPQPES